MLNRNMKKLIKTATGYAIQGDSRMILQSNEEIDRMIAQSKLEKEFGYNKSEKHWNLGFISGYKQAKAEGTFTKEQMEEAIDMARMFSGAKFMALYSTDKIIQSFPVAEVEVEEVEVFLNNSNTMELQHSEFVTKFKITKIL